jgi:glycosyltransferase involved in cell wall biosynthesis
LKTAFLFVGMPIGGAEDFALGVHRHLAPEVESRFVCLRSLDVLGEEARRSGIPLELIPVFPTKRISPFGIWRLSRWMVREGIELVHSQTHHAHIHGVLAAKFAGIRCVVHQQKTLGKLGARQNFLLGLCFRQATAVVALSERTAGEIQSRYGVATGRLHVVPNAIDESVFHPAPDRTAVRRNLGLPTDGLVAGTVASLHPVKNHLAIIEALSQLPIEGRPTFVFVGDGTARPDLERLAESKGVRIVFAGRQRPAAPWFQALDFFVLASHWEGQPLAMLQALACGLPVLASRIEGNTAVLGDNHAGLFDPRDSDSLASLIRAACSDPRRFRAPDARVPTCREAALQLKSIYSLER